MSTRDLMQKDISGLYACNGFWSSCSGSLIPFNMAEGLFPITRNVDTYYGREEDKFDPFNRTV